MNFLLIILLLVDNYINIAYNTSREIPTCITDEMEVHFMIANTFIDNAKVMSKGQVTIPKDIREILGITSGDRVTFVVENGNVRLINSAVYAMQMLQAQMAGLAESSGLDSEDAVMDLVKDIRAESENE